MSSTNRSKCRESHVADYYVTPQPAIEHFLKELAKDGIYLPYMGGYVLDPCAGGDQDHEMSYPTVINNMFCKTNSHWLNIETIDIRPDSLAHIKTDYLKMDFKKFFLTAPAIIITNPPFNIAIDVIKKSLAEVEMGGLVIMLLRLNFFGSQERFEFWQNNMPIRCYVHSKRMKFIEGKSGDSIEYMHCVWRKGPNPSYTELRVI